MCRPFVFLMLMAIVGCLHREKPAPPSFANMPKELSGLKKMKLLPGGRFAIGDGRMVTLSPFYIDCQPVTYKDFEVYVSEGGEPSANWYDPTYRQLNNPVTGVSWYHAADFCNWRSLKEGLKPFYVQADGVDAWGYPLVVGDTSADGFRLPTEAQFEYAATCGKPRPYPWGEDFDPTKANFDDERGIQKGNWWRLASVESQYESECGIFGMSGNIWHWCHDWYGSSQDTLDPQGPAEGRTKAKRGGSWGSHDPERLKTTARSFGLPSGYNFETGFRCVRPLGNKRLSSGNILLLSKTEHTFWKPSLPQGDTKEFDVFGEVFEGRLARYFSENYPECLYFHIDIDQQPKLSPDELAHLVVSVSKKYNINPVWLTGIMCAQSGLASCSFPRWFNNPTAVNWQLSLSDQEPSYTAKPLIQNQKFKNLEDNFNAFCTLINKPFYRKAAQAGCKEVVKLYVGVEAPGIEASLDKTYMDLLRVRFSEGNCSDMIYKR